MTWTQLTLIVPLGPNVPGMSVAEYDGNLAELEVELIADFGGLTSVDGRGDWRDSAGDTLNERVRVYTLGLELGNWPAGVLGSIRQRVKVLLDQQAVYLAAYDLAEQPVS